jgi:hypothetical protein
MDFLEHSMDIRSLAGPLKETQRMKKPELVLTSTPEDAFLSGVCFACPTIKFSLKGNNLEHEQLLRTMFDNDFRRVHSDKTPKPE